MDTSVMIELTVDSIPYFTQSDIESITLEQLATLTKELCWMFSEVQVQWFNQEQYALWKQTAY